MISTVYSRLTFSLLLTVTFSFCSIQQAAAQKRNEDKITKTDREQIIKTAKATLDNFIERLKIISDANTSEAEKTNAITSALNGENYIFTKKATIEDDLDAGIHTSGKAPVPVENYLNNFMSAFSKQVSIAFKTFNTDIMCVKMGKDKIMSLALPFNETIDGTDLNGTRYTENARAATFIVFRLDNGDWKTIISDISFYNANKISTQDCIDIDETGSAAAKTAPDKPDNYYSYMLSRGSRLLSEHQFPEAYYALKEAARNAKYAPDAGKKQAELIDVMTRAGSKGVNNDLINLLTNKGRQLEATHYYREASQYYAYAYALNPQSTDLRLRKSRMDEKAAIQKQLDGDFDKQQYAIAISEYTNAINNDPENSDLYLGRAKCYGKIDSAFAAKRDFSKALSCDPTNIVIYKWKGKYFEQQNTINTYDSAYASFIYYVNKADDKNDPDVMSAMAEATFCKGMSLSMQGRFPEAIDSFDAAIKQRKQYTGSENESESENKSEQYKEAYCYRGYCFLKTNKTKEAFESFKNALEIDDNYPDAHFRRGEALFQEGGGKNADEGIREMERAIDLLANVKNETWFSWNIEVGDKLTQNRKFEDAIVYYDKCIDATTSQQRNDHTEYYLKRGECYKLSGRKDKALNDFMTYKAQCEKRYIPLARGFQKEWDELNAGK